MKCVETLIYSVGQMPVVDFAASNLEKRIALAKLAKRLRRPIRFESFVLDRANGYVQRRGELSCRKRLPNQPGNAPSQFLRAERVKRVAVDSVWTRNLTELIVIKI
jgi:hypothetical protein